MKKILKLIKKYQNDSISVELLHDLRVACRSKMSILNHNSKYDESLKLILKNSNEIRDCDVLIEKCKYIEVIHYLHTKKEKNIKKFLSFLDGFKSNIVDLKVKNSIVSKQKCLKYLEVDFLSINDKELHKVRIFVKQCRYVFSENNEEKKLVKYLKNIQTFLGESRDYYNCIKLIKKFDLDFSEEEKKKLEFIKIANDERIKLLKEFK
jgi:CHAD domain-containing protein